MRSSTPHVCRETVSHGAHKILTFNRCTWSLWTVFNLCWPKALLWLQFPIWVRAGSTCVFLGQLSSKVDPGVLAHIINLPAKCQVRCEISADSCSPYPTFFCFSRTICYSDFCVFLDLFSFLFWNNYRVTQSFEVVKSSTKSPCVPAFPNGYILHNIRTRKLTLIQCLSTKSQVYIPAAARMWKILNSAIAAKIHIFWDFPGGPVAKTPCSQFRGPKVWSLVRRLDPTCRNLRVCMPHLRPSAAK